MAEHNHATRDIKDYGRCPACDAYWEAEDRALLESAELKENLAQMRRGEGAVFVPRSTEE